MSDACFASPSAAPFDPKVFSSSASVARAASACVLAVSASRFHREDSSETTSSWHVAASFSDRKKAITS